MFLAFNGGKDCTVLLHLVIDTLLSRGAKQCDIRYVYIQSKNPFNEVDEFVKQCETQYKIRIETIQGSIKKALEDFCLRNTNLKACLMGCRRTDPYCGDLKVFQVSNLMVRGQGKHYFNNYVDDFRKPIWAGQS